MPPPAPPQWLAGLFGVLGVATIAVWIVIAIRLHRGRPVVERRRQRRAPWGAEGGLLAAFLLASAAAAMFASASRDIAETAQLRLVDSFGQAFAMGVVACLAIGVIAVRFPGDRLRAADFGLVGLVRIPSDLVLGVLTCVAMLPPVYATNLAMVALMGQPTPHPAIQSLLEDPTAESIAAAALMAVVVAPLVEELAFRVLLQGGLQRYARRSSWWPVLASSLAFGMAHTNQGYAPIPIFVLALGLGYLYRQTHSYPAVVATHMAFNAISLAVAIGAGQSGIEL